MATSIQNFGDAILTSLNNLWLKVMAFIPEILSALVVLIIGLIIATVLEKIVLKLLKLTKVDKLLDKAGVTKQLKNVGIPFSFSGLISKIVKWFVIIAVLIIVADILNIPQITQFLERIVLYIPNVLVAIVILAIGMIVGKGAYSITYSSAQAAKLSKHAAKSLGVLAKWSIVVFALLAALTQLNIASELIQILFTGIVVMLALAGGLAFGLGGKDKAGKWLDQLHK
ncbi:hypothetical protein ACFLZH_02160 [Patescibacteria group bacterium]